jgi:hypothetical protein
MPIKDMEMRDSTLYIMNEDGTKTELGPVASVDVADSSDIHVEEPVITHMSKDEVTFEAIMDLSGWQSFIRKYMWCNNYRKMLGLPMKRRKSMMKARKRRLNSMMRRWFGSVKYGEHVFKSIDIDAAMRIFYLNN